MTIHVSAGHGSHAHTLLSGNGPHYDAAATLADVAQTVELLRLEGGAGRAVLRSDHFRHWFAASPAAALAFGEACGKVSLWAGRLYAKCDKTALCIRKMNA